MDTAANGYAIRIDTNVSRDSFYWTLEDAKGDPVGLKNRSSGHF